MQEPKKQTPQRRWYVRKGDKEHGPFTSGQLEKLIATGKVSSDDDVRRDGAKDWQPISRLMDNEDAAAKIDQQTTASAENHGTRFREWYSTIWVSGKSRITQVVVWLCYGYVWIPVWFIAATRREKHPTVSNKQVALIGVGFIVVALAGRPDANGIPSSPTLQPGSEIREAGPVADKLDSTSRKDVTRVDGDANPSSSGEESYDEGYQNGLALGQERTRQHNRFWTNGEHVYAEEVVKDVYSLSTYYMEKASEQHRYGNEDSSKKLMGISAGIVAGFTPDY